MFYVWSLHDCNRDERERIGGPYYNMYTLTNNISTCSRAHQEIHQDQQRQVQGAMPSLRVHIGLEGLGQGREAEAEFAAR